MKQLTSDDVYVSVSGMDMFFACPAKYKMSRDWSPKFPAAPYANGVDAHAILGGTVLDHPPSNMGREYARALGKLEEIKGYKIIKREFVQMVELASHLYLKRIIDGAGSVRDNNVLIDYKTSSKGFWSGVTGEIIPQAMGYQAIAYLIPPTDPEDFWYGQWPTRIDFLVSNHLGMSQIYNYTSNPDDLKDFLDAAKIMGGAIKMNRFPKKRGYQCTNGTLEYDCPYLKLCYQQPGWEMNYVKKEDRLEQHD